MTADHISHLHTSLLHTLFDILNEGNVSDSNYILAHYFLEHYVELRNLNIFDVANECFVSRSSVRRFCKSIGYENFMDLKAEFARFDEVYYNNLKFAAQDQYQQKLSNEIGEMISNLTNYLTGEVLSEMVRAISSCRCTVFMIPGAYEGAVKDFQEKMVNHHRVIYLISENYSENELLKNLTRDDLLITLSISGVFAEAAADIIQDLEGLKILITCNDSLKAQSVYDHTYVVPTQRSGELQNPVYSKYGVPFMLDNLYSQYVRTLKT